MIIILDFSPFFPGNVVDLFQPSMPHLGLETVFILILLLAQIERNP